MSTLLESRGPVAAVTLLLLCGNASAQLLRERDLGENPNDAFGYACASIGDVTGDKIDDFIVGAPNFDNGGRFVDAGKVVVYSGATGGVYRYHIGLAAGDLLGLSVAAAGDVDHDKVPDYVVGAPYHNIKGAALAGLVVVYSGKTGAMIWTKNGAMANGYFGYSVSGIGDVDGDGNSEVVVGTAVSDEIYVLDHLGGTVHHLTGPDGFGYAVSGCADLDGDGILDFVVGIPFLDNGLLSRAGAVDAYSGASGGFLHTSLGTNADDELGRTLASMGDVDGDRIGDYLAGSPYSAANGSYSGIVRVISGASGATIREQPGDTVVEYHGESVCGMGDANHDGVPDYAVGARQAGSGSEGRVRICSGSDGTTIYEWYGVAGSHKELGSSVGSGDWNGDGVADLLAGDWGYIDSGTAAGALEVDLMCPAWWANYGAGWPGTYGIPGLASVQDPEVGSPIDIVLGNSLGAATTGLMFVGLAPANLPINNSGTLLVTPLLSMLLPVPASGLLLSSTLPNDPALYCVDIYLQAVELDSSASKGLSFTAGLQLRCGFDLP